MPDAELFAGAMCLGGAVRGKCPTCDACVTRGDAIAIHLEGGYSTGQH